MAWNEAEGRYDYGEIDWDEFWAVVKGHGPLNKARVAARKKAWEDGAWVREAALGLCAANVRRVLPPLWLQNEREPMNDTQEIPLWEVFIRPRNGLAHRHCGSLHAADSEMALQAARDVYTRRGEGLSVWVDPFGADRCL